MGAAAIPLIVGGTILTAVSQRQQLQAQGEAAKFNALQAAENARIVRRESRKRAAAAVKGGEALKSTQKAAFGKAGVLLTGSAQDILTETERITREDIEAILTAGETGSREALFQAAQFGREAAAAKRAATIAPLATLVTGAGTAAAVGA